MPPRFAHRLAALGLAMAPATAHATWSILIVDTRTGEIALGSATCLTRLDLRELTPVLISGVGAATAQSAGDSTGQNRALIRDRLLEGVPLTEILAELSVTDNSHESRQYGMVDIRGDTLTFSGAQASSWAGGLTGTTGDLAWAVQGNILTGANVVSAAADAIENTPGDLAARLMAAMVAARVNGGDGRCSCDPREPESCGSPPPGDFKSAHIGYMLIARIEDADASRAYYFAPSRPGYFAATDLDAQGGPDLVVSSLNRTTLTTFLNRTAPGDTLSHAALGVEIEAGIAGITDLHALDVTGDGADDLVFLGENPASINLMVGLNDGSFGPVQTLALDAAPGRLALGALDADPGAEAAVTLPTLGRVLVLDAAGGSPGGWGIQSDLAVPGSPTGVAIARIDDDDAPDLAVTQRDLDTVLVLRRAGDLFEPMTPIPTDEEPVDVAAGDFNADGAPDMATANDAAETMSVLLRAAPGLFDRVDLPLVAAGIDVQVAEMTGDDLPDLISFAAGNSGIQIHTNRPGGVFETTHQNRAGAGQASVLLTDIGGDGLTDMVSGSFQRGLTLMDNLGDGTFPPYNGFGNGDYFMALNVADSFAQDADPVDQLAALFQAWRQGLEGRIDAVQTVVSAPSRVGVGSSYTVVVQARDWQGDAVSPAGLSAEAFAIGGDPTVTSVRIVGPGMVEIDLAASPTATTDRLGVRLNEGLDGIAPVRLMPDITVRVLADLADFNADGARNFFDFEEYLTAFNAGDPGADLTGDGVLDGADVAAFIALFVAG